MSFVDHCLRRLLVEVRAGGYSSEWHGEEVFRVAHAGSTHTTMGEPYCVRNCKGHQANQSLFEILTVTNHFSIDIYVCFFVHRRWRCLVAWGTYLSIMPKTLAFNYITKSAVEKNCLARQIIFDFDVALLYIMSMHVFITNLSIVVPKRDGVFEKQVSQETVSCGPHGRLRCWPHGQTAPAVNILPNPLCSRWCSPGRGTAGFHIVHSLGHMGVVVSTGHGCCCSQGPPDMYPLGHPGGEPQPHHFEWRTTVFSHAPHLCMPPMSKLAILLLGFYVYLYILIEFCVGAQCCYISSWNTHARTPWACADSPRRHVGYHTQHHD